MPFTDLPIHLVRTIHRRAPLLDAPTRARVFACMSGICRNIGAPLRIAGGVEDHLHLLIDLGATVTVAQAVRDIKANSSRFLREAWPGLAAFRPQSDDAAFAVSRSGQDPV